MSRERGQEGKGDERDREKGRRSDFIAHVA